ncbi:adenosine receptor A1-like [Glandiceps talaboti]
MLQMEHNSTADNPRYHTIPTAVTAFLVTMCILNLLGSIVAVVAVVLNRRLNLLTKMMHVNVLGSTILTGTVTVPLATWMLNVPESFRNYAACVAVDCVIVLSLATSAFGIMLSSICVYYQVVHPFRANLDKTEKVFVRASIICWIASVTIAIIPATPWNNYWKSRHEDDFVCFPLLLPTTPYFVISIYFTITPVVITGYGFYFRAHYEIRKVIRQINTSYRGALPHNLFLQGRSKRNLATLVLLLGILILGWIPMITFGSVMYFCPECFDLYLVLALATLMLATVSPFGSLLYCLRLKENRRAIYKMMCSCPCKKTQV